MRIPAFLHHEARDRPVLFVLLAVGGLAGGVLIGQVLLRLLRVFFPSY